MILSYLIEQIIKHIILDHALGLEHRALGPCLEDVLSTLLGHLGCLEDVLGAVQGGLGP